MFTKRELVAATRDSRRCRRPIICSCWIGRLVSSVKASMGPTPKQFAPLFERLGISADGWCKLVKDFGRLFSVVAGQPHRIDEHRSMTAENAHRFRARREARELLATA